MTRLTPGMLLAGLVGCQPPYTPPEPRDEKSPVVLSIEFPNAAGGGPPYQTPIHVRNRSGATIKAVRDFLQSKTLERRQYEFVVRDAAGVEIEQRHPFTGGPVTVPLDKDYVVLGPGEAGTLEFTMNSLVHPYGLRPGRLYYLTIRVRFDGLADPATLVVPFGFAPKRED